GRSTTGCCARCSLPRDAAGGPYPPRRIRRTWTPIGPGSAGLDLAEVVAHAPLGQQEARVAGVVLDLLAQPADGHVDRPDVTGVGVTPHLGQQGLTVVHAPGVSGQVGQQLELPGRQIQLAFPAETAVVGQVDHEIAVVDAVAFAGTAHAALGP